MKLFGERFRPVFGPEGSEGAAASAETSSTAHSGAAEAPSSAPSEAPASAPSEAPAPAAKPPHPDFSALGMPMDDDDVLIIPDTPTTPPPAPVAPEVPPATAQPAAQPPAAKPTAAPPAEQTPKTAQAPAPSAAAVKDDPEGLVTRLSEHREAIIDGLAAERFRLSEQEINTVTADPAAAVPRLLARAYFESTQASLLHMQNFVPKLVVSLMRDLKEYDDVENRFYSSHKPLEKAKHDPDVRQFARAFRAANPRITEAELFPMVAYAVMAKHGLMNQPQAQQPAQQNGRAPATPSFVPARPGVGGARVTVTEDNPFMGLGRNFDDE